MNKKMFAIDMDGTLLIDSKTSKISDSTKDWIKKLQNQGHIICLFTGRPWRATKKVYDELKLDTVVVNYNGAYIHHPKQYEFVPIIERIPINHIMRIISSSEMKKIAQNIVIEGPRYIHLMKNEKSYFTESFIKVEDKSIITSPLKFHKMSDNPTGVLIEIKKEYAKSIHEISEYFKSKYGDLAAFSYWEIGKNHNPILEFTNFKAKKDIALIKVARFYNVDMNDTIAFGDGFNDIQMLKIAGVGVALNNASNKVKSYANVVSRYTNKNHGIAKFLKWYFNDGEKKVQKTIYNFKKQKDFISQVKEDDNEK